MPIGFIGVGNMGLPMAEHLIGSGEEMVVYDIRASALKPLTDRQARPAASPREVADRCQTAFVSLPTLPALKEVVLGANGPAASTTDTCRSMSAISGVRDPGLVV